MKKKFLLKILLLITVVSNSFGSVSLIMPNKSGYNGTQITIPVKVKNFHNILSVQGTLQFNPAIVTFSSVQQYGLTVMNAGCFGTSSVSSGKFTFSWFDGSLAGQTLADSAVIFSITFNIVGTSGQVSSLSFINSPTALEIINTSFTPESITTVNGSIQALNAANPIDITLYLDTVTGASGSQVIVSMRAVDFTNINSLQGTVKFNPSVVTYSGIGYYGLPGMNPGNFGTSQIGSGKLTFSWNDATLMGINKANSAALFSLVFNLTGSPGTQTLLEIINAPTPVEVTDSLFKTLNTSLIAGRIKISNLPASSNLVIFMDSVASNPGSQVILSVHAKNFKNIISAQGTLQFNTSVAGFYSLVQYGLPYMDASNFGTSLINSGKLMFSWNDPTGTGITIADSAVLFTVKFTITGSFGMSAAVDFINVPTPQEYVDNLYHALNVTFLPGHISIPGTSSIKIFNPSSLVMCKGDPVSITYNVTGNFIVGNKFILQLSNASGNFSAPINIDTLNSITSGVFNTFLPLGIASGTAYLFRVISTNPSLQSQPNTSHISISGLPVLNAIPTGNTSVCIGTPSTYSIPPVADATSYTWTVPAGWTINSGQSTISIQVTAGGAAVDGDITIDAGNSCGISAIKSLAVTVDPGSPMKPWIISGPIQACQGASEVYSTIAVPHAYNYTWGVPTGWTISAGQGTTSITVSPGNAGQGGDISITAGNSCGTSNVYSSSVTVIMCGNTLNLKVFLEGLYAGSGKMDTALEYNINTGDFYSRWGTNIADTISVELHDIGNYSNIIYSTHGVLLNINGTASVMIPYAFHNSYYITVKGRSHLETTSATPVLFPGGSTSFDFTDNPAKAYAYNMKSIGGISVIYAGDISSYGNNYPNSPVPDAVIDITDVYYIFYSYLNGDYGYSQGDLSGDGAVDLTDIYMAFNNYLLGIFAITP